MRGSGRLVRGLLGAAAVVEMALPGPPPAPFYSIDPRYGSCTELVQQLGSGAWFDDHVYDAQHHVLLIYGTQGRYRLNRADAECIRGSDVLTSLVRADVESHRETQASECRSLLGNPVPSPDPIRPEVTIDLEALAAYRDEVCAGPGPSLLLGE